MEGVRAVGSRVYFSIRAGRLRIIVVEYIQIAWHKEHTHLFAYSNSYGGLVNN